MNDKRIGIGMISAFMMVVSSAALAAEEMLPSEYYRATILPKDSGIYEYQEKLFVHSKAVYESKKPSAKKSAKLVATVATGKLLRTWAIDLTAPERATKERLSERENRIKALLDSVDNYWQFPDWQIAAKLQCLVDKPFANEYVVGMVGEKVMLVSMIPETYKAPCTSECLKRALPIVAQRQMKGENAEGFMKVCGAWDLVGSTGASQEKMADFKGVNDEVAQYAQNAPLAKKLAGETAALSVPQIVTNKTSVMNEQGTMLTEKMEITTVTRFPRMQKLFLNCSAETNYPTARLPSGTAAIASIRDAEISIDERMKLFKTALCDSPGDKELWNFFGRVLMAKNDNLGAIICFRNALKLDARFIYPIVNLACAYKLLGKNELALGTAIVGRGLATDAWSIQELDKILWGGTTNPTSGPAPALTQPAQQKPIQRPTAEARTPAPTTTTIASPSKPKSSPTPIPTAKPSGGFSSSEVDSELDF